MRWQHCSFVSHFACASPASRDAFCSLHRRTDAIHLLLQKSSHDALSENGQYASLDLRMYAFLKKREQGALRPLRFQRAETTRRAYDLQLSRTKEISRSHRVAVNSIKIETIEQRYLMSGGADGRIHIYDLATLPENNTHIKISPVASVSRADRHTYAVSAVAWFPFDTGIFVSSSQDTTIRVWDANTMTTACVFPLDSPVNSQAISPIASHCLVASAASEPHIRLCDLNSGAFTHSLTGHVGSVLSVAWSPSQEHILYSGGQDGTVRVWDVRRASACLLSLDQDNAVDRDPLAETNSAHGKGVNGLTLTSDGAYLVSLGLDEKIRLWDTSNGHNTLVNYGSLWRNRFKACIESTVSDGNVWPPLLYAPSDDRQVLVFSLLEGRLIKRLRGAYGRVTSVAKRPAYQELYSGSNDCEILIWEPASPARVEVDEVHLDAWSESDEGES